ncbi:MAG: glycosyl hydrolase [Candidatus Hadarchaeales archaeon]
MSGEEFLKHFSSPPKEYTIMPFWFLNKVVGREELKRQIREMKEKGVYGFFIHPRRGLEVPPLKEPRRLLPATGSLFLGLTGLSWDKYFTEQRKIHPIPYLREPWWEMVSAILEEAAREGMVVGIYDEIDWPSGTAGMQVTKRKELRMKYLLPSGQMEEDDNYIDVMSSLPTEEFISLTHEEYWKKFRHYFGKLITSFFSDEVTLIHHFKFLAAVSPAPWSEGLEKEFEREHGYRLDLSHLWKEKRGAWRTRIDFWSTVTRLYSQNFHGRLKKWCEKHGVKYTGHVLAEETGATQVRAQGNIFEVLRQMHWPGVDHLTKKQGGSFPRIASSVAHYMGSERVPCEAFGSSGWGLRLGDMYRIANWLFANGVNMIVPHAFYLSTEGFRYYEYPPSQFFQAKFWPEYGEFADYIRRVSYTLSQGVHDPDVAVLYPVQSLFAHHDLTVFNRFCNFISAEIENLHVLLGMIHMDYDFLDEKMVAECRVSKGRLRLRKEEYRALIIPAASYLPPEVRQKVEESLAGGVKVIFTSWTPFLGECEKWSKEIFGREPKPKRKFLLHHRLPWLLLYQWLGWNLEYVLMKFPFPSASAVLEGKEGAVLIDTTSGLSASRKNARLLQGLLGKQRDPEFEGKNTEFLRLFRRRTDTQKIYFVANISGKRVKARLHFPRPAKLLDFTTGNIQEFEERMEFHPFSAMGFLSC